MGAESLRVGVLLRSRVRLPGYAGYKSTVNDLYGVARGLGDDKHLILGMIPDGEEYKTMGTPCV